MMVIFNMAICILVFIAIILWLVNYLVKVKRNKEEKKEVFDIKEFGVGDKFYPRNFNKQSKVYIIADILLKPGSKPAYILYDMDGFSKFSVGEDVLKEDYYHLV